MDAEGTDTIAAPRASVWAFLTSLRSLSGCVPGGIQGLDELDDHHARIRTSVGGGLFAAQLALEVDVETPQPPDHAVMAVDGQVAGTRISGQAELDLGGPPEGPTTVAWKAHVDLQGSFAAMAEPILKGSAQPMIERALECARAKVTAG